MTSRKPDVPLPSTIVESLVGAIKPAELGAAQRDRMRERILKQARETAPEGTQTLRSTDAQWVVLTSYIEIRELSRDERAGTHVSLVRMRPGGVIEAHRHTKEEDFIVLEGECHIGAHLLVVGDSHRAAIGSHHAEITTRTGVLVLVRGEFPYPSAHL